MLDLKGLKKTICVLISSVIMLGLVVSCSENEGQEELPPASYGTYGSEFARSFASNFPYRKAYSESEKAAGKYISDSVGKLGLTCQEQPFTSESGSSANYVVKIPGTGFYIQDHSGNYVITPRTIVIGAHYDSIFSAEEVTEGYTYDGINDNASGVACLMTILSQIKNYNDTGYNVIVVFFGAGNDSYAGAEYFYNTLSAEEKNSLEAMYCVDSIYAGDKIYANSGYNSLFTNQKYKMRRKLYQAYDIAYEYMLYSKNGFNLLYNESNVQADLDANGTLDVYREVSANKSDYVVFDQKGIPVVFFDSFDYNFDSMDEMIDTKNLSLQEFDGMIRGTLIDSSSVLDEVLVTDESDLLETRINNVAFVILESLLNSADDGMNEKEYNQYLEDLEKLALESESIPTNSVGNH